MTKDGMRGLAAGLLISTVVLSLFHFSEWKTTTKPEQVQPENNAIRESDLRAYADDHDLIILQEHEYHELISSVSAKEDSEQERIIYQLMLDIPPGTSSKTVAERLAAANIIDDVDAFMSYLQSENLSTRVKSGNYHLDSSMTTEDIAELITD